MDNQVFTIGVGGAAGEGVKSTGIEIGKFLQSRGFSVYLSLDYPSLIKGGHNFIRMTGGREKVWSDHSKLDILVCLNGETENLHKGELKEGVWVLTGLNREQILGKVDEFLNTHEMPRVTLDIGTQLIDGNTAFGKGLQAAGLDYYIAYPMTPSTGILHYLAGQAKPQGEAGLKVIQPENEIAAINMALGVAYAGKRAAVGSATGGFALMQEGFSFSGMAELPVVVAISQRQAPATGVPTRSSQSDLRFAIHAGHGEFPRIVLAPGDAEEAFRTGADAVYLAWKYRVPVIVLLDKILSEHMMTVGIERLKEGKIERFENQNATPGTAGKVVKVTSYEHNEEGFTVDTPEAVKLSVEKRFEKKKAIEEEVKNYEYVKVFGLPPASAGWAQAGDHNSDNVIVFWGSTKGAVLEAAKYLDKPAKLVQIISMEPFPTARVEAEIAGKKVFAIENNHEGQLASLIREKTGIEIKNKILKYDSMPFDPEKLAEEINSQWK